jgi:lysophospholipase L1-like esterase
MRILQIVLFILLLIILADLVIRTILLFRLYRKVDAKGDYLERNHELGKGKPYVITLLGASSIYGEGTSVRIPFAGTLAQRLVKKGRKVIVHNLAVSGHKVADVIHEQVPKMEPSDLIIVYTGTKDCLMLTPTSKYLNDLKELAQGLDGKTVLWVTIADPRLLWALPVWLRWLFHIRARRFTVLLKQVVAEHSNGHWWLVDFFAAGSAEAARQGLTNRQLVSDGIHLSDNGQALISDMIDSTAGGIKI